MRTVEDEPGQEDMALWRQAREGDPEAFGELVRRHQRRIWMICRQYVGPDEAEAAAQDTFLKAWSRLETFDGRAKFGTWLARIAINTCLDRIRRRKRRATVAEEGAGNDGPGLLERMPDERVDPERWAMQRQAVERLGVCEERLSARQREVFRLRFYAEMDLEEIARSLGIHVGTVKTQLHRAVHRLRRELGDVR